LFHIFADCSEHTHYCQPAAPTGLAMPGAALINQMEFQLAELLAEIQREMGEEKEEST